MLFTADSFDATVEAGGGVRPPSSASGPTVALSPYLFPPVGSSPIYLNGRGVIPAGAAPQSVAPAALSFSLRPGFAGVIRVMDLFVNAPTLSTDIEWRVSVNGNPVEGLSELGMQMRDATSLSRQLDTLRIEIPDGGRVDVLLVSNDTLSYTVGAILAGWFFPVGLFSGG